MRANRRTWPTRVVDAILTGVHERRTSHYELLRAFADEATLGRADQELEAGHYQLHEFGDSVLFEQALAGSSLSVGS